jgi:hypothetical protein
VLPASDVQVIGEEEGEGESKVNSTIIPKDCKGNVTKPVAEPGHLCIFVSLSTLGETTAKIGSGGTKDIGEAELTLNPESNEAANYGAGKGGALIHVTETTLESVGKGVWAVTAP